MLGVEVIVRLINKRKTEILVSLVLAIVLTSYFLFQSNFVYEVTGSLSYSLPLSGYKFGPRLATEFAVVNEQEVEGAQWLSHYIGVAHSEVYSGYTVPLISYGSVDLTRLVVLSNISELSTGDYVYLGTLNTRYGLVVGNYVWNTTDIQKSILSFSNEIYSSGECEIYEYAGNR